MADGTIGRAEVLKRAVNWVAQRVPYSQAAWWSDANGTYRQDCSGYVSMAWRLNPRANYWTGNLASVSHRIPSAALLPGDVLNLPRKHVVIFAGWVDSARTRFNLYEQYATGATPRYATNASLAYYLDRGYGAFRYNGIGEAGIAEAPARPVAEVATPAGEDEKALVAAETEIAESEVATPTSTPSAAVSEPLENEFEVQLPPGVVGVPWTPEEAAAVVPETAPPPAAPEVVTPVADPQVPQAELVQAQREMDQTAQLTTGQDDSSSGYMIAAGLGLMFLGLPLGVGARMGAWSPARAGSRRDAPDDGPEPPARG